MLGRKRESERERYHQGGSFIGSEMTYFHGTMFELRLTLTANDDDI